MKTKLGFLSLLLMQFTLACAHVDTFAQDIELIRTSDEQMMQKMDLIQQLIIELKNSQASTDNKIQKFAGDLTQVRENQAKSEVLNQENAKLLKQLADPSHQEKQCNCVLQKLNPINEKLLQSAALIKGLVKNATEMFQQIRDTKALVQDCGNAASEVTQILRKLKCDQEDLLKKNSTDAPTIAKPEDLAVTEIAKTSVATNKEPENCFKTNSSIIKSNLIFGKKSVFYYVNSPMNWSAAQKFCHSIGMEFPTLKTEADLSEVKGRIPFHKSYGVWVFASNKVSGEDVFYWGDDSVMTNELWREGAPNRFRTMPKACVWLDVVKGRFGDWGCSGNSRPLCQALYRGVAITCT